MVQNHLMISTSVCSKQHSGKANQVWNRISKHFSRITYRKKPAVRSPSAFWWTAMVNPVPTRPGPTAMCVRILPNSRPGWTNTTGHPPAKTASRYAQSKSCRLASKAGKFPFPNWNKLPINWFSIGRINFL